MDIETKEKDGALIAYLDGEITLANANDVSLVIDAKIEAGAKKVIMNLEKVTYLDSSAVGMIVATFSNLQSNGGELKLCALKDEVLEVFKAASLDSFLTINATEEESLLSF